MKPKLIFQNTIEQLGILAAVRRIDSVVRAHHRRSASFDRVGKRPCVDFMHCAIVNVGRHGFDGLALIVGAGVSLGLLLVADVIYAS